MDIITAPNPILNSTSSIIEDPTDPTIKELAHEMARIMYETNGCGLAAPQLGQNIRLIVSDCQWAETKKHDTIYMVNPQIIALSDETDIDFEGCLSVPGIVIKIERALEAEVRYTNLEGKEKTMNAQELWARCFQHEIDHLDGITMLDRVRGIKKIQAIGAYTKALDKGAKPGDEPLYSI